MEPASNKERKEALGRFTEYAIGFGLFCKGWDEAEQIGHFPFRIIFIFMAGLFVIVGAALHRRITKKIRNFSALFYVLEGLVEIVCASILLEKGKHWIPVFLAFIGLSYLSQGLTQFLAREKNREKALVQFRTIQGIVFIAFGAAMAALNAVTDRKIEVYGACAVFALGGIIALLRRRSQHNINTGVLNKAYTFLNRK